MWDEFVRWQASLSWSEASMALLSVILIVGFVIGFSRREE